MRKLLENFVSVSSLISEQSKKLSIHFFLNLKLISFKVLQSMNYRICKVFRLVSEIVKSPEIWILKIQIITEGFFYGVIIFEYFDNLINIEKYLLKDLL